jgi:hypothetical protein
VSEKYGQLPDASIVRGTLWRGIIRYRYLSTNVTFVFWPAPGFVDTRLS